MTDTKQGGGGWVMKACPGCKHSDHLRLVVDGGAFVLCDLCKMRGPLKPSAIEARHSWDALPRRENAKGKKASGMSFGALMAYHKRVRAQAALTKEGEQ